MDMLPSSHSSPSLTVPSPQEGNLQRLVQSSSSSALPSSQASTPVRMWPSPQAALLQLFMHPSSLLAFPSSHSSPSCSMASPHWRVLQSLVQVSSSSSLPSSQSSTPMYTMPSPHAAFLHSFVHSSEFVLLPSSHSSPSSIAPLPQGEAAVLSLQPAPAQTRRHAPKCSAAVFFKPIFFSYILKVLKGPAPLFTKLYGLAARVAEVKPAVKGWRPSVEGYSGRSVDARGPAFGDGDFAVFPESRCAG